MRVIDENFYNYTDKIEAVLDLADKEIDKLEFSIRLEANSTWANPLSMYLKGGYKFLENNYALLFNPYQKRYLKESLIKTYSSIENVISILSKYAPKSLVRTVFAPEWLINVYKSADNFVESMLDAVPFNKKQFVIAKTLNDGVKFLKIFIPNIDTNVELTKKAMQLFGYFCSKEDMYISHNSTEWVELQFEPHHQKIITQRIKDKHKFLYHVSPSKFDHKIEKYGLCPASKNDKFIYPNRVFMMLDYRKDKEETYITTPESIKNTAFMLLQAKIEHNTYKDDEYVNDNIWSVYQIDVSKLSDNSIFSYDSNAYPLAVFTTDNIPPSAMKRLGRIDLTESVADMLKGTFKSDN